MGDFHCKNTASLADGDPSASTFKLCDAAPEGQITDKSCVAALNSKEFETVFKIKKRREPFHEGNIDKFLAPAQVSHGTF